MFALIIVALLIISFDYTEKQKQNNTIKELAITENTILFTVSLEHTTCYIAESKTNGYVDVEIDCK